VTFRSVHSISSTVPTIQTHTIHGIRRRVRMTFFAVCYRSTACLIVACAALFTHLAHRANLLRAESLDCNCRCILRGSFLRLTSQSIDGKGQAHIICNSATCKQASHKSHPIPSHQSISSASPASSEERQHQHNRNELQREQQQQHSQLPLQRQREQLDTDRLAQPWRHFSL
jgi:hypothetical protein